MLKPKNKFFPTDVQPFLKSVHLIIRESTKQNDNNNP
jgi:hypothetical protein